MTVQDPSRNRWESEAANTDPGPIDPAERAGADEPDAIIPVAMDQPIDLAAAPPAVLPRLAAQLTRTRLTAAAAGAALLLGGGVAGFAIGQGTGHNGPDFAGDPGRFGGQPGLTNQGQSGQFPQGQIPQGQIPQGQIPQGQIPQGQIPQDDANPGEPS